MRFERMIRRALLAGAALALPGGAMAAAVAAAPIGQSGPQSGEDYRWIDQADALWDAIGDAPPDFAFPFEGQEPWAWQTADGYTIIVEDAGTGGIRSYYFEPGARAPFLAVEPGMSFAFEGGRLAMVYDADGEAAPRAEFGDYRDPAMDLYARGRRLLDALAGRDYRPVDAGAWIEASPYIFDFIQIWDAGRTRYPGWSRYHGRSDAAAWRRRLEAEQRRRRDAALRFRDWRTGGFQGPPPGRFHVPGHGNGHGTHQPGGNRPAQPGRPGRPDWHGGQGGPGGNPRPRPGATPGDASPPPMTRPTPSRPDGSPGWRRGRPPVPPTAPSATPSATPAPGNAPAAQPAPTPQPRPDWRGSRGNGGAWQRPPAASGNATPPVTPAPSTAPMPPATVASPPVAPTPRPRPEGGWRRPAAPSPDGAPAPQFRPRPSPGFVPSRPAPQPSPAPSVAPPVSRPSYSPPVSRPSYSPPVSRPSYSPPVSRPSYSPPVSRPSYSPPVSRPSYSPPVSRPSYTPPVSRPSYTPPVSRPSYTPPAPRPSYTPPPRSAAPPPPRKMSSDEPEKI